MCSERRRPAIDAAVLSEYKVTVIACRVVNIWNSLSAECTNFSSLNSFRHSLSSVDFSKF